MSNKTRLDVLLVEQGLLESRQKAQAVIMAGSVFVDGQRVDKPGTAVPNTAAIQVRGHALPYVSRGGLKLEKAMQTFPLTLDGKVCADIGASTGGFTDCMLQNGATKVYAVDVGYGQLDWKLRGDPRVVCMERTNARYLTHEQFEAGREKVGKKGVVRDPAVHLEVLEAFLEHAKESNFTVLGITYSPIRGPEGNIEYLGYLRHGQGTPGVFSLPEIVEASHSQLKD